MRLLVLLALLMASVSAFADLPFKPRVSGVGPTTYVSGEPLDPTTELSGFNLYCDGNLVANITPDASGNFEYQFARGELSPGQHSCTATALDLQLQESDHTNPLVFAVTADRPATFVLSVQ
jgi:hypothetical protein